MESIFIKQEHTCASKSIAGLAFTTVFSDVCCNVWGPKGENTQCCVEQLVRRMHLVASKTEVSWVKLLSGLFSGSWVTPCILVMSLLPLHSQSFIITKLLRAFHFPTWKNMNAPAWGGRFSFLWVLNMNSDLSSRKHVCTNTHMQRDWEAERKTVSLFLTSLLPALMGSWQEFSSYNFILLLTYSLNFRSSLWPYLLPKEAFGSDIVII